MATKQIWQIKQNRNRKYDFCNDGPFVSKNNKITFVTPYNKSDADYGGICDYDEKENKIKIIQKFPENMQTAYCTYGYDPSTDEVIIIEAVGKNVVVYNRKTQKWRKLEMMPGFTGYYACCIHLKDKIHLFGGSRNNNHIICDIKNKSYKTGVSLPHKYKESVAIKGSNDKIFVVGGRYENKDREYEYSQIIYEILANENNDKSSITNKYQMPRPMRAMGCIHYQSVIYIFGGDDNDNDGLLDTIYSFNTINHKWAESSITIPSSAHYHAVLLNDDIHLFQRFSTSHHVININTLINAPVKSLLSFMDPLTSIF